MSDKFNQIYQKSINNPEEFWKDAAEDIFWFKKPTKILNKSKPSFLQMVRRWGNKYMLQRIRYPHRSRKRK